MHNRKLYKPNLAKIESEKIKQKASSMVWWLIFTSKNTKWKDFYTRTYFPVFKLFQTKKENN